MPDLRLSPQDSERIAHYLLQRTRVPGALAYTLYRGQVWEGLNSEEVRAERAGQVRDFSLKSLGEVGHHGHSLRGLDEDRHARQIPVLPDDERRFADGGWAFAGRSATQ